MVGEERHANSDLGQPLHALAARLKVCQHFPVAAERKQDGLASFEAFLVTHEVRTPVRSSQDHPRK